MSGSATQSACRDPHVVENNANPEPLAGADASND
jgi:hypothetical protein